MLVCKGGAYPLAACMAAVPAPLVAWPVVIGFVTSVVIIAFVIITRRYAEGILVATIVAGIALGMAGYMTLLDDRRSELSGIVLMACGLVAVLTGIVMLCVRLWKHSPG